MAHVPINVLLLERDPGTASRILRTFTDSGTLLFNVKWATDLAVALELLGKGDFGAVLIGSTLDNADRADALGPISLAAPSALILVPALAADKRSARKALPLGAQDRIITDPVDVQCLPQILPLLMKQAETAAALRKSEARIRAMSEASPLGIFVAETGGGRHNGTGRQDPAPEFEQVLGTSWAATIHPDDRDEVLSAWRTATRNGEPFRMECRLKRGDESVVWVSFKSAAMRDGSTTHGHVLTAENITDRKTIESGLRAAQEALFDHKKRTQVALDSIGDAVLSTDLQGRVTYMNLMAQEMTGWSLEEAMGKAFHEVFMTIDSSTGAPAGDSVRQAILEDRAKALSADCILVGKDGRETPIEDTVEPIHDRAGAVSGAVIIFHHLSQSRAVILRMAHLAQHDSLTGLPNRVLLSERLSQAIGLARRHRKKVGLLYMDLDHFKPVNDSLGHATGDQLLRSVADRLLACVRDTDTVCRQGGDEFVILLNEIESLHDAAHVAEKCRSALSAPYLIRGNKVRVTPSIGISIYPDDGSDADTVIQQADTAMFKVKAKGRNNYQFYNAPQDLLSTPSPH